MVNMAGKDDASSGKQNTSFKLIRILYMVYSMAIGSVLPFLSIYYKSLGHGGEVIGLIASISPFTTFLVGPIWGIVTDKVRSTFLILYITSVLSMLGQLLVFHVEETHSVMILVCVTAFFSAPVKPLIDSLVMNRLGKDRAQFGKLRLFSLLGSGIAANFSGRLLKMEASHLSIPPTDPTIGWLGLFLQHMTGFRPLIFAYTVLHIPTFVCIRLFQKEQDAQTKKIVVDDSKLQAKPSASMKEVLGIAARDPKISLFFILVYLMGISAAAGDSFTYIRFQEVGGTGADMGTSRLISSVGGAAMFWHSGSITARLGIEKVLKLSLIVVATRFALLSFMTNIYVGYIAELLRGMTFGCFWSSATVHASRLAPVELQVTMMQVLNGVYNGIGRSSGALIAGNLQAVVGTANTFKYGAIANIVTAVALLFQDASREQIIHVEGKRDL